MKLSMDRRSFIQSLCILCAGWTVKGWAAPVNPSSTPLSLTPVSETRSLMGTFVTITLFHPSRDKSQSILEKAFLQMESWVHLFNRHESGSPLSYLNKQGVLNDPPPELLTILQRAKGIHTRTGGVFDVTIKPVLDLYETERAFGRLPQPTAIQKALPLVGISGLKLDPKKITFGKEGMGVTLDGIAKGTIVDSTINFLKKNGIGQALVNAGGDLRVIGGHLNERPWRIAVYDPDEKTASQERIALNEGAVSTSGCYFVYFDQSKDHFHVLSPENGVSPSWSLSATVIAPSSEEADALATALMLLSPEEGLSFINQQKRLAAMLITKDGRKIHSLRWPKGLEARRGRSDHV
jgi:FAD:protein FMN transferase